MKTLNKIISINHIDIKKHADGELCKIIKEKSLVLDGDNIIDIFHKFLSIPDDDMKAIKFFYNTNGTKRFTNYINTIKNNCDSLIMINNDEIINKKDHIMSDDNTSIVINLDAALKYEKQNFKFFENKYSLSNVFCNYWEIVRNNKEYICSISVNTNSNEKKQNIITGVFTCPKIINNNICDDETAMYKFYYNCANKTMSILWEDIDCERYIENGKTKCEILHQYNDNEMN